MPGTIHVPHTPQDSVHFAHQAMTEAVPDPHLITVWFFGPPLAPFVSVWVLQEVDAKMGLNIRDLLGKTAVRESGEGVRGVREICQTRCKFNPCGGEEGEKKSR